MVQKSLNEGILVTWTKSFACPDGVGEDAVRMLEDALHRKGVGIYLLYCLQYRAN
jgi:hexokinase